MNFKEYVYFFLLIVNVILVIFRWKVLNRVDRYIGLLLCITLVSEFIALNSTSFKINKVELSSVYNALGLFLLSLYFNESVKSLKRIGVGWITGISGIVFVLAINLFSAPTRVINAEFLLVHSTIIIIFCLFSIRQILLDDKQLPYHSTLFWFTCAFLIFWSATFTGWGVYSFFKSKEDTLYQLFSKILMGVNYFYYCAFALILYNYKKLIPSGE